MRSNRVQHASHGALLLIKLPKSTLSVERTKIQGHGKPKEMKTYNSVLAVKRLAENLKETKVAQGRDDGNKGHEEQQ